MAKLNNNAIVTQLDMADYKTSVKRIFTKIFIIQQQVQGHQKTKKILQLLQLILAYNGFSDQSESLSSSNCIFKFVCRPKKSN